MAERILVLTGEREAGPLTAFLRAQAPLLRVEAATSRAALDAAAAGDVAGLRLIAFLSGVIVPAGILNRLVLTPYNIHPGSPDFPGLHPEAFALAAGARQFGATAHEMAAQVDAGTIVALETFAVPPGADRMVLAARAYEAAVQLFRHIALHCLATDDALPALGSKWAGPAMRRPDYAVLLARRPDLMVDADRGLRLQAVGL